MTTTLVAFDTGLQLEVDVDDEGYEVLDGELTSNGRWIRLWSESESTVYFLPQERVLYLRVGD